MFRPPLPDKEAAWAAWLPFPLVAVFCESDAGLATAGRYLRGKGGTGGGVLSWGKGGAFSAAGKGGAISAVS